MDIFQIGLLLTKPPLTQKSLGADIDFLVCIAVAVVMILFSVIKLVVSYRKSWRCPCCDTKTKIIWLAEKREPTRKRIIIRFGRGTGIHAVPVARCPKCGFEIDLGQ